MKFAYLLYVVKDTFENKCAVVANCSGDTVQICGMKNCEGENVYFESDAYHLYTWCHENDLSLREIVKTEEV